MKEKTIVSFIELLEDIKESGLSIPAYCEENDMYPSAIYNKWSEINKNHKNHPRYDEIAELYNSIRVKAVNEEEVDSENCTEISYDRDDKGHILYYKYKIS